MQQYLQNKKGLVQSVFDKVYDKYDIMNDLMSLGVHRIWKKNLINWMNPGTNKILADVACGTGDIAKLYIDNCPNNNCEIFCIDPNEGMMNKGRKRLYNYKNIKWIKGTAEKLSLKSNSCDYYTISFGLRNTKNIEKSLSEAYRVLKPGGRFFCLEFSKIQNLSLNLIYKRYSKLIPEIGKFVVGEKEPYEYLTKSIQEFVNQEELIELLEENNFVKCEFRNFTGGIVSLHSGWKI